MFAGRSSVTLIVSDSTPPEIQYIGGNGMIQIPYGTDYGSAERVKDVKVIDSLDGSLDGQFATAGRELVNTVVPGVYTLSYTIRDRLGNSKQVYREVQTLPNTNQAVATGCSVLPCARNCAGGVEYWVGNITLAGVSQLNFELPSVHRSFKAALVTALQRANAFEASVAQRYREDIASKQAAIGSAPDASAMDKLQKEIAELRTQLALAIDLSVLDTSSIKRVDTTATSITDTRITITIAVPVYTGRYIGGMVPRIVNDGTFYNDLRDQDEVVFSADKFLFEGGSEVVRADACPPQKEAAVAAQEDEGTPGWHIALIVIFLLLGKAHSSFFPLRTLRPRTTPFPE